MVSVSHTLNSVRKLEYLVQRCLSDNYEERVPMKKLVERRFGKKVMNSWQEKSDKDE